MKSYSRENDSSLVFYYNCVQCCVSAGVIAAGQKVEKCQRWYRKRKKIMVTFRVILWPCRRLAFTLHVVFFSLLLIIVHRPFSFIIIIFIQHLEGHTHYSEKTNSTIRFSTIIFVSTAFKLSVGLFWCMHV